MKCFVDGCPNESQYARGGFCESHYRMLRASLQQRIADAIREVRDARQAAIESLSGKHE